MGRRTDARQHALDSSVAGERFTTWLGSQRNIPIPDYEKYWILLDEWGGAGYSCITSIDEQTLGVVYEGSGANLIFQQIDVRDICR